MVLDYLALAILVTVAIVLFYGVIALCDVPYQIARRRNHPHQDAIQVAGWVSLFTCHAIWPFLWIWAMLYRPATGWNVSNAAVPAIPTLPVQPVTAPDGTRATGA
jgi:hypothetical protein